MLSSISKIFVSAFLRFRVVPLFFCSVDRIKFFIKFSEFPSHTLQKRKYIEFQWIVKRVIGQTFELLIFFICFLRYRWGIKKIKRILSSRQNTVSIETTIRMVCSNKSNHLSRFSCYIVARQSSLDIICFKWIADKLEWNLIWCENNVEVNWMISRQ